MINLFTDSESLCAGWRSVAHHARVDSSLGRLRYCWRWIWANPSRVWPQLVSASREASFWKSYATFIRSFSIWEFVFFGLQNTVSVVYFQLSIDFAAEWVICSAGKHVVMCGVILSEMDRLMWFFSVIIITELLSSSTLRSTGIYLITSPKSHVDWIFRDSYIVTL